MTYAPPAPGIYTPVPTFFKKDNVSLDLDSQIAHAKYLQKAGIKGLVVFGSTGELTHVTRAERFEVVSAVHKALPDFPIAGGVYQGSVAEAIEEVSTLKKAGASYAMIIPSSYFGPNTPQQGVISWFNQVAEKSELPILIYCFPAVSNGFDFDVETLKTLSAHPKIVGAKFSHGNVSYHAQVAADEDVIKNNFSVFTGLGQVLLPVLTVNVKGTIDALSGAFPKTILKIYNSYLTGKDLEAAASIQSKFSKAEEIINKFGPRGAKKSINLSLGIGETYHGRAPLDQDIPDAEWAKFEKAFNDVAKIEKSL